MIDRIISGGQTGADRAALDVAIEMGISHGGWIPQGRRTEDGKLPEEYRLRETKGIDYAQRTELNVVDADGTLIASHGKLAGGSALTQKMAAKHRCPCLHMDLDELDIQTAAEVVHSWIEAREITTLNVAGPRASEDPAIYEATKRLLETVLKRYLPKTVEAAVERLLSEIPLKRKAAISRIGVEDLASLHFEMGQYVQRRLGLWFGNDDLMASCRKVAGESDLHEDDASALIIKELWKRLRESHVLRPVE